MKYLNLTKGFNPYNADDSDCLKFESFIFNGGEPHIKLVDDSHCFDVTITSRLTSTDEFMMVLVAIDALHRQAKKDDWGIINLFLPYFPAARQDRVCDSGEALTVKLYTDIINKQGINSITIFDPHSDVVSGLLDNCYVINNYKFVERSLDLSEPAEHILVSPDAGAFKKIYGLAKHLSNKYKDHEFKILESSKTRDVITGKLLEIKVHNEDLLDGIAPVYICDDIIDGGGTFIGLAKELKNKGAGDIYLIVSHGIFSRPLKELKPYFKKIYTTDSWRSEFHWEQQERDCTDLVEIVEFKDFL